MISFQPMCIWAKIPHKTIRKILSPLHGGMFTEEDALVKNASLLKGKQGHLLIGHTVTFYFLLDDKGIIFDAKFQYFGHPLLIALAETVCELVIGKTCNTAYKISVKDIVKKLETNDSNNFINQHFSSLLHLIIDTLDVTLEKSFNFNIPEANMLSPEAFESINLETTQYDHETWEQLSNEEKINVINQVILQISSIVAYDNGAVTMDSFHNNIITISYSGACSGCFSSVGSTLHSIENMFKKAVYSGLKIRVNETSLTFALNSSESTKN